MFIKYAISASATNSSSNAALFMADILGIFNGTKTSTADFNSTVCNTALSEFTGALNTSIYSVTASDSEHVRFTKLHYQHNATYPWGSSVRFNFDHNDSSDMVNIRCSTKSHDPSRYWPYGSDEEHWTDNDTGSSNSMSFSDYTNYYIWANDNMLCIVADENSSGNTGTNQRQNTFMLLDYEKSVSDEYAYSLNTYHRPQVQAYFMDRFLNDATGQDTNYPKMAIGKYGYLAENDTFYLGLSQTNADSTYYNGSTYSYLNTAYYFSFDPAPNHFIYTSSTTGGDQNYLIPVTLYGHGRSPGKVPSTYGKCPGIFRTSSDIGVTGDSVTISSVEYAILATHKHGGSSSWPNTSNTNVCCWLIPKE